MKNIFNNDTWEPLIMELSRELVMELYMELYRELNAELYIELNRELELYRRLDSIMIHELTT